MLFKYVVLFCAVFFSFDVSAEGCWQDTTCTGPLAPSFPGIWELNSYSPATRTVSPVKILNDNHSVISDFICPITLKGNGSLLVFDFGQEVGGVVTISYQATGSGALGLAFTEAKNWTGEWSDSSNGGAGPDGALYANITATSSGSYTMPNAKLRGGFRYLTLFTTTNSNVSVSISAISLEISFQPTWSDLRAYGGYFHSNDQLLNRIWYAGAYTLQTTAIPPDTGREYPLINAGWMNDANLGTISDSVFVDGAKRDRAVWAGDLGIAVPSVLVSTGDSESVKNALQVQYTGQNSGTGELPMVGPPINFYGSDTYHMATLIGTHDYILHSNDLAFMNSNWVGYVKAMTFITSKIDQTGMLSVTGSANWGRAASEVGHTTDGNMLLYRCLMTGSSLANWTGHNDLITTYTGLATKLKAAVNDPANNWDSAVGAFRNSDIDASIYPEDGNSMALLFAGALPQYALNISTQLTTNWGHIGAITPELPHNIVPYIESFEIKGHLAIRQTQRALDLIRRSWGWYLNNLYGTGSTCIEGYLDDGTFRYQNDGYDKTGDYPSHSHGWSTGPTDALTSYVLGLRLTAPGGSTWTLAPQFGDLTSVEGGFTTPLGKFSAGWMLESARYAMWYDVPGDSSGVLILAGSSNGKSPSQILLDGIGRNGSFDAESGLTSVQVGGGSHNLVVAY